MKFLIKCYPTEAINHLLIQCIHTTNHFSVIRSTLITSECLCSSKEFLSLFKNGPVHKTNDSGISDIPKKSHKVCSSSEKIDVLNSITKRKN